MELILKSNNEQTIAKIIAFAKKLDVTIEKNVTLVEDSERVALKAEILNFKSTTPASFGDAAAWQKEQREDRELPFA